MDPITLINLSLVFIISIWFHEYAHAWSAHKLWDNTPLLQWRLTPNPLKHIDPIGFLMIFLIHFGWGKPVEIMPTNFKNPIRDELIVSLAWPASNLLMATIWAFTFVLLFKYEALNDMTTSFLNLFIYINIALAIFNLIPIPPLDGYRIIKFMNPRLWFQMEQYSMYFGLALLLLIFLPWNFIWTFIKAVVNPIYSFLVFIAGTIIL